MLDFEGAENSDLPRISIGKSITFVATLSILNTKLIISIFIVAIIWGTTFLGIKIGVETIPPWFVAGFRQLIAGLIMLPVLVFSKQLKWIGWANLRTQLFVSLCIFVGANGLTTVAEQHLTSSLTALLSALSPVFIFIGSLMIGIEKFSGKVISGIVLGIGGVVCIFWDGIKELANPDYLGGILTLILGLISWAIGVLYFKKKTSNVHSLFLNLFYQFIFAGLAQIILGFLSGEKIHLGSWSYRSISAVLYLAVFGSVITYFAYYYLLEKLRPIQVSMLTYINTIISIFLGWLVLNEAISAQFLLATLLIISGVFVMNYCPGIFQRKKISNN